jgi:drug/metabolite transporter (DMT)-like permease
MTSVPAVDARDSTLAPLLALIGGALAMGISPIFVRIVEVGPFASAFWRVALALPVLWLWMRVEERHRASSALAPASFATPTVLAGLLFGADLFFWHLSLRHTTVANATFFATTAPLWVVFFGWLLLRQRVSRFVLLGLGLCLLGGAAIVAQSLSVDVARIPGDIAGIATSVMFGLYFLAVGSARTRAGAARVTFELSVIAAAVLLVIALAFEGDIRPPDAHAWVVLLALALISHAGGQGLLSVALGRLPTVFSSLVIFIEAIAAAIFAWIFLGEAVSAVQAIGGALILVGIWVARPRRAGA